MATIGTMTGSQKKLAGTLHDKTRVLLVDGAWVRNNVHGAVDFVEGGHGYVYKFIPKNEIWVEDIGAEDSDDVQMNMSHEIIEYALMKYGKLDYDHAHELAASAEDTLRKFDSDEVGSE
jgi:hypothetical protein